jgi:integrase
MKGERERQTRRDAKGRILKKGEGQDKQGRYYFVYTDKDGKRRKIYSSDLVELREQAAELQKKIASGIDTTAGRRTLNEQFERYLKTKDIRESTMSNYKKMWDCHVKDNIGKKKIVDVKKSDLQMFYKSLKNNGLADGTIKLYSNGMLNPTFKLAVDDDIIMKNPNSGCMKEYTDKPKEKEILTEKQQAAFLDYVRKSEKYDYYYPLFQVMFSTALRRSEIAGLTWDKVDFENGFIYVKRQLIYADYGDGYKFHASEPKTDAGIRVIPISKNCYKALKMQREFQFALGIDKSKEVDGMCGFVFTTTRGKPYTSVGIYSLVTRMRDRYNEYETSRAAAEKRQPLLLPEMSCHTFRHTGCTRLAETHMDIKSLQEFMGHSDIGMTMNIYNHADSERIKNEVKNAEKQSKVI